MSATKAALKAAKTALDAQKYDEAISQAQKVLDSDATNYFAKLFLGRAFEKQAKLEEAAQAYQSAADSKPDDTQAWLGLCSLYETQASTKLDEYREAAVNVAKLFGDADDKHRCQTTVDKLVSFTNRHGTATQRMKVLELQLPGSPIYDFLEGRIPHPSHTYLRLTEITEAEEQKQIKTEINNKRTRIGAKVGQVTLEVKREVYTHSRLEDLYRQLINWSTDDEVRRQFEEKLLQRAYDTLVVLPVDSKSSKLEQVLDLAEGMVIIHHPLQLAWDVVLESRDLDSLQDLDVNILREYVESFANSGTAKVLRAWLGSELSPFPLPKKEEGAEAEKVISADDRLLMFAEGLEASEQSPFAYRLTSDYYLHLEEHQAAADTARSGIKVLDTASTKLGMSLQNTKDALNSVLATALVHHQAPRYHGEARRLFEDILQRKPKFTPALIGLGLIFEEIEDYQQAIDFLNQALEESPGNLQVGTELAWCKALKGDYTQALHELEEYLPQMKAEDPRAKDLRALVIYRTGACLWQLDTSKSARRDRNGAYSRFLSAIKTNVNFAPAYTSLGVYYGDYSKDKKRARQCFQKAFELSSAETLAAERLAKSFADQGDWEIVEVIAQRVIDSGRARPPPGSKKKGISWPYSALGVVQMNKLEYQQAIVSFLAALRISPDDYQSYVGLGESYHNSGRYNSALRTFNYALESGEGATSKISGETWFARYMLANVHRELGEYEEATEGLKAVLEERPSEFGVLMSLLQTFIEWSWRCVQTGLFGQAIENANSALATAVNIAKDRPDAFNMWKAAGDAAMVFANVQSGISRFPASKFGALLGPSIKEDASAQLSDIDYMTYSSFNPQANGEHAATTLPKPLVAGILAYKRAIGSSSDDVHAQAVAWFNLGWSEERAFSYTVVTSPKQSKMYLRAAVRCFKRAIELEAGNAEFWNALGVVTTLLNPKVAQHSFVRSLHLNELNAKVWTNLGVLYLLQGDHELAHQAFGRSQSTDPDYAHAWLGEGLIALLLGDAQEALNHFTHAFGISDSSSVIDKKLYSQASFDHLLALPSASNDLTALIQPLFALQQLQAQSTGDLPHRHLAALFLERVGNHAAAIDMLTVLCEAAEAEFEASEALAALAHFAHAKADLARNQLAGQLFKEAIENAETALDLSSDAENSGLDAESCRKLRLSSHLTAGLANFKLSELSNAVGMFKQALQESKQNPDVVCLLVKVLWAQGGQEEKSVARDQLFECVEQHPEHVGAVTLLGAIAALDDDTDTVSAVRDDLLGLRTKDNLSRAEQSDIESLISAIAALCGDGDEVAGLDEAQADIVLHPDQPRAWSQTADLTGDEHSANMALRTAGQTVPPNGDMESDGLAKAFAGVGSAAAAQQAIALAPWEEDGWKALSDVVSA